MNPDSFSGFCDLFTHFLASYRCLLVHRAVTLAPEHMHIMRKLSTATCDHLHHWSRKGEGFTLPCLLFFYVYLTVDHFVEA
ncbi:hypothetical protein D1872_331010 [compost metagenome]